jgi:hypothetical protein
MANGATIEIYLLWTHNSIAKMFQNARLQDGCRTGHANFDWMKCQKTVTKTIALSLSHTHNLKISCLPTKNDEYLPTWQRKNRPKKVSRLHTTVGSPDTIYRSVSLARSRMMDNWEAIVPKIQWKQKIKYFSLCK